LSFDDNKVLKMSIEYANICSSMQDHRKKFSVFNSSIGSADMSFWRSSEADVIRSTLVRSCSPEADVIRGFEGHQKLED